MKITRLLLGVLLLVFTLSAAGAGEPPAALKVAGIFADGMVLQRGVKVPVWGWGAPGAKVTVEFAGQRRDATVEDDGKWSLSLAPLKASSNGSELKVSSGGEVIVFKDVLVGEVWLCSGQSNLQRNLSESDTGLETVAHSNFPDIRFVIIPHALSPVRQDDFIKRPPAWRPVNKTNTDVSAIAFFFAKSLQQKLGVPVGLIISAWEGSVIQTWIPKDRLPDSLTNGIKSVLGDEAKYVKIWNENDSATAQKLILEEMAQSPKNFVREWANQKLYWRPLHCFPGWTFNAKINPLIPFAIKGVLWYQGEDNHAMGIRYSDYLTCMATAWRKEWNSDLPFFIVMLAPYKYESPEQLPAFWMAQMDAARRLKNAEVVCTVDLGNPDNIHPRQKEPVGERIAMAVMKRCFGAHNSSPGPVFKSVSFKGGAASVVFDNVAQGLEFKGDTTGFEIAGEDGKFVPAQATISGKDSVILQSGEVPHPVFIRYAWNNTPLASLFNSEGLSAIPLSTEWNASHGAAADKKRTPVPNNKEKASSEAKRILLLVGTYTHTDSKGIYVYEMNPQTGGLSCLCTSSPTANPTFLVIHPNKQWVYAVNESDPGSISAFRFNRDKKELRLVNSVSSHGVWPCYISLDKSAHYVMAANYGTGNVGLFSIGKDGAVQEACCVVQDHGRGPNSTRQEGPHAHMIIQHDHFVYEPDLGIDEVMVYRLDAAGGKLLPTDSNVVVSPGAGPRHLAFHPVRNWAYVVNELNGSIDAFRIDPQTGAFVRFQTVSTLPHEITEKGTWGDVGAEIEITPSGKYLYASNRGEFNDIAMYSINQSSGELQLIGHQSAEGKKPRTFAIDPTGAFLLVANQDTDDVVTFRIDPLTGKLVETGLETTIPSPVCLKFL
jgi:6-phosphogluconolactonase (cycloisomerase 2 family)